MGGWRRDDTQSDVRCPPTVAVNTWINNFTCDVFSIIDNINNWISGLWYLYILRIGTYYIRIIIISLYTFIRRARLSSLQHKEI